MKFFKYTAIFLCTLPFFVNASYDFRVPEPELPSEYSQYIQKCKYEASSNCIYFGVWGIFFTATGILTLLDIPVTATENIALAARQQMDEAAQKKQKIGARIAGRASIALGLFLLAASFLAAYDYNTL